MGQGSLVTPSLGQKDLAAFQDSRGAMLGLAYRMLGSRSDAEDVLQDVFLKWQAADREAMAGTPDGGWRRPYEPPSRAIWKPNRVAPITRTA